MKALIAGGGGATRELLDRLGDAWSVTLIDTNPEWLELFQKSFKQVKQTITGDASSLVTLADAKLEDHDFVVAITGRDEANLEICRLAKEKRIGNIVALAGDSRNMKKFEEIGVRVVCGGLLAAQEIQLYMENPRLFVKTIGEGKGEIMEVEVSRIAPVVGKKIRDIGAKDWMIGAIYRGKELIIPQGETEIEAGDRVTIIGHAELYQAIFHLFKLDQPSFPVGYGLNVLAHVDGASHVKTVLKEAIYLVKNTKAEKVIICARDDLEEDVLKEAAEMEETVEVEFRGVPSKVEETIAAASLDESVGCVLVSPAASGFFSQIFGRDRTISFASRLGAPLVIPRGSHPYGKILVPYSPTKMSAIALEIAHDIASQVGGKITVVVVSEPAFIRGEEPESWTDEAMDHAREVARIYKFPFDLVNVEGNRVKEVVRIAGEHDLLIIGSTTKEASFLKPHVDELMARRSPCSVMVVTF